jgi:hypothetical protein
MEPIMKTTTVASLSFHPLPTTDEQLRDELDVLVLRAAQGDDRAIAAIAVAFGPILLAEASAVLGDFEDEAVDVMQDFLGLLLERRSRFTPAQGRAIPWMCGLVRAMARKRRCEREREWGDGTSPASPERGLHLEGDSEP